jgi:hypothetical protein
LIPRWKVITPAALIHQKEASADLARAFLISKDWVYRAITGGFLFDPAFIQQPYVREEKIEYFLGQAS